MRKEDLNALPPGSIIARPHEAPYLKTKEHTDDDLKVWTDGSDYYAAYEIIEPKRTFMVLRVGWETNPGWAVTQEFKLSNSTHIAVGDPTGLLKIAAVEQIEGKHTTVITRWRMTAPWQPYHYSIEI